MTARSARTGRTGARITPAPVELVKVAVVTGCTCGMFPLDKAMHRTSGQAWQAAAAHVALNPTKCRPALAWDLVPAALAAGLPEPTEAPMAAPFAVVA